MRRWIYKSMSDEALMSAYSRGNSNAFEYLYLRHKDRLFSFLYRQCSNISDCEELAHDTWMAVIKQSARYQRKAKFTTWLFQIAHNRLVDYWRKFNNKSSVLIEEIQEHHLTIEPDCINHLTVSDLTQRLEQLPKEQIETLLLKIEGFSHAEIADITNSKQETVKSRLRYATNRLRTSMEVNV